MRTRLICTTLLALFGWLGVAAAQERSISVGARGGYNLALGGYTAISLEGDYDLTEHWTVSGGALWSTIGRTAVELRRTYKLPTEWGSVELGSILHYSRLAAYNNLAAGVGVGLSSSVVFGRFGYYYRAFGAEGGHISEPFNLFYELGFHLLPKVERCDLQLIFTNCELLELERHYQPSWILRSRWSLSERLGLVVEGNYKSAGMFHMSTNFYQLSIKAGLCYNW